MKTRKLLTVVGGSLLAGVTVSSAAAGFSKPNDASNSLTLTDSQQQTAWHDLYMDC
jgi:hypothetical protein